MVNMVKIIQINTNRSGLFEITDQINEVVFSSNKKEGLCSILIMHTSASLTIQENADPTAAEDLVNWLNRLVPENDPIYRHTAEGPDDMPAHIKSCLTQTNLNIPVMEGSLTLGTWQGIYLWEHRKHGGFRKIAIHI